MDHHNVCERLDTIALHIIDVMQGITKQRQSLDECQSWGFVNLAKSRYLMGSNTVSMLQIQETDISPSKTVVTNKCTVNDVEFQSFEVIDATLPKSKDPEESLRHRGQKSPEDILSEGLNGIELTDKNNRTVGGKDPLKWFGVLVPQTLRTSQKSFKEAIDIAVRVASLQNELNAAYEEYKKLSAMKEQLSKA